jgi:imidazolonepropionase-like amidohydrolase
MDALISATRIGAMAIGIEKTTGTIQIGKFADLLLLSADPTGDIENIDKVDLVIRHEKLFNHN